MGRGGGGGDRQEGWMNWKAKIWIQNIPGSWHIRQGYVLTYSEGKRENIWQLWLLGRGTLVFASAIFHSCAYHQWLAKVALVCVCYFEEALKKMFEPFQGALWWWLETKTEWCPWLLCHSKQKQTNRKQPKMHLQVIYFVHKQRAFSPSNWRMLNYITFPGVMACPSYEPGNSYGLTPFCQTSPRQNHKICHFCVQQVFLKWDITCVCVCVRYYYLYYHDIFFSPIFTIYSHSQTELSKLHCMFKTFRTGTSDCNRIWRYHSCQNE